MRRCLLCIVLGSAMASPLAQGQAISFLRQIAVSDGPETPSGIAADATGVYVTGNRRAADAQSPEAFLRRFDAGGNEVWTRWLGPASDAWGGVVVTGSSLYVAGSRQSIAGNRDGYLAKYDTAGNEVWTRQVGSSSREVAARGIAVDGTGVYVVGLTIYAGTPNTTPEVFIRKYDFDGAEQWVRPYGAATANAVAADETGVYVAGAYLSSSGFVRKYDADGNELWTSFTGESTPLGIAVDTTGAYVAGISYEGGYLSRYGL